MYIDCNVYICVLMNSEEAKSFTSACITSTKHKHYKNDTYRGNVNYLWAVRILSHLGSCGVNIISYYSFSPEPQSVLWPAVNTITKLRDTFFFNYIYITNKELIMFKYGTLIIMKYSSCVPSYFQSM